MGTGVEAVAGGGARGVAPDVLRGPYEVIQIWQASVVSVPAVDVFRVCGRDDSDLVDAMEIRGWRR
ncbi:hypothetical protein [Streptomyces flaveolus]|uniref:hypothetical protein n=1 Tax=Streptomyces flaveolus TaxID=67297 RepID=UPI0033E12C83